MEVRARGIITFMGIGGRRNRWVWRGVGWLGGAVVAASMLYAVVQLWRGGHAPADTVGLFGLLLGTVALWFSAVQLREPHEIIAGALADKLADQVAADEGRAYGQLLGDDHVSINLAFTLQPHAHVSGLAKAPARGRLLPTVPPAPGVPDVAAYWRNTQPRRLVVTGPAGSGKTVFALALILALLRDRAEGDPVPVRIPISRWDTYSTDLTTFITQRLTEAYRWPRRQAAALVEKGMVLPVLDGLDEMDSALPEGRPDPDAPRAWAALDQLDRYRVGGHPGPVVVTCRTAHLEALADRVGVRGAAQVAIEPVSPNDAVVYLTDRSWGPSRWQPLTDHLTMNPTGATATWLSTPWRLCLVATVYQRTGDPSELVTFSSRQALDEHLLDRFILAATRLHPLNKRGRLRAYQFDQVRRWLRHLAYALPSIPAPDSEGETGLVLHKLWPLAGRTRVRIADAALAAIIMFLPLPLAWTTPEPAFTASLIGLVAVVAALSATAAHPEPPGRLRFSRLAVQSSALVRWLTNGRQGPATRDARPWRLLRDDFVLMLVLGLECGLALGLVLGLVLGQACGLVLGLTVSLAFVLTQVAVRRYTVFLLCSRRRLPFRLVVFLDWACEAGLLRQSGVSYQFRHRELQAWLTRHPDPAPPYLSENSVTVAGRQRRERPGPGGQRSPASPMPSAARSDLWLGITAAVVLLGCLLLAWWGLDVALNGLASSHTSFGPETISGIIGAATGVGGLIAGVSVGVSRILRAVGRRAADAGQGAQANNTGQALLVRAELEGRAALVKATAEGDASKTRALAELKRAEADKLRAQADLRRAEQGLPPLPSPASPSAAAAEASLAEAEGAATEPSVNGSDLSNQPLP